MKLAIMQPYLFPYIGYFQLINAVDKFVFYDDVQFIKGGWINRNYILENGKKKHLITLHLDHASPNRRINEIRVKDNSRKLLKTIRMNYIRAPYFDVVFPIIERVVQYAQQKPLLSDVASLSILEVSKYLKIETDFVFSSKYYAETLKLGRVQRLTSICTMEGAKIYTNPFGGRGLYSRDEFIKSGVELYFLTSQNIHYKQFNNKFIPNLSIIDVLMFNSIESSKNLLQKYHLE